MKIKLIILVSVTCFVMPVYPKIGETVPELKKRFGNPATIQKNDNPQVISYGFNLNNYGVAVYTIGGVSVSEGYFSRTPLVNGEPPNDIVQGVLKTVLPNTHHWKEVKAATYDADADYAMQSGDFTVLLHYSKPPYGKGGWTWMMIISPTSLLSSKATDPHAGDIQASAPTPTATPVATPEATPVAIAPPTPARLASDDNTNSHASTASPSYSPLTSNANIANTAPAVTPSNPTPRDLWLRHHPIMWEILTIVCLILGAIIGWFVYSILLAPIHFILYSGFLIWCGKVISAILGAVGGVMFAREILPQLLG